MFDGHRDLHGLFSERATFYATSHAEKTKLIDVYHGDLPSEFDDYFPDEMHTHVINMTRLAWDDLAQMAGKVFTVYCEPDNDTDTQKKKAEKRERIAHGWQSAGRRLGSLGMERLMQTLAWWLVGTADAVALCYPSYAEKTPYFTFRDTRTHLPPPGYTPWGQGELDGTLFAYQMTLGELMLRYPERAAEIRQKHMKSRNVGALTTGYRGGAALSTYSATSGADENALVWVGEYYSRDSWIIATLEQDTVVLMRSDQGDKGHPGVCPVVSFTLYSPLDPKGRSGFADQISMQAAMSRMFSQKLDFYDKTLYPMLFTTPLADQTLKIGPMAINIWETVNGVTPNVTQISPQNPIDSDEMMNFVTGMSRMLNRNPEMMQGGGDANSAKALEALRTGVNQTVSQGYWPSFLEGLPRLFSKAAQMCLNLWPAEKLFVNGLRGEQYIPARDLLGYQHDFQLEQGIGMAGPQGTIEVLQLLGGELISEDTAREQLPGIRNAHAEKIKVQNNRLEKLLFADLQQKIGQGQIKSAALVEIRKRMATKGVDFITAVGEVEADGLLYEPPPEMPGVPGMEGLSGGPGGGLPPELAGRLGLALEAGGVPGGESLPTFGAMRGA